MTDIGDDFTIETTIRVDGVEVDPGSVTLTVTDPAGAVTTPTPTNPDVGVYRATVTLTSAGRWRWRWTTTGPAGVDDGHVDVAVDPPPRLEPLATIRDIEEIIGRELTAAEAAKAPGLLRSASTRIRAFCRQQFDRVDDDTVVLRPTGGVLRLPQRPVLDVTAVVAVGSNGLPDLPVPGWTWDGRDTVDLTGIATATFVALPSWWDDTDRVTTAYRVTYSHGYDTTPDLIVDICRDAALRALNSPSPVEGVTQTTIGQFSEQFQQAEGSPGVAVRLSPADRKDLVDNGYRRTAGTIGTPIR